MRLIARQGCLPCLLVFLPLPTGAVFFCPRLRGHNDEILDVAFNANGSKLVTASADGTCAHAH